MPGEQLSALENVQRKVYSIHSELLSKLATRRIDELPILKNLMKEEVAEYWRNLASSSLNCFCRRSSWDPAVRWGGIGIDRTQLDSFSGSPCMATKTFHHWET